MKKIITFSTILALGCSVYADTLTVFSCGMGVPGIQEPQLIGLGISPNGKYVCGPIENGSGIFVAESATGEVKWEIAGEMGSELRHIDNNGLAIGYIDDDGALFSFDTGEESLIPAPEDYRYVLGEALSDDGSILVGSLAGESFDTEAAYCNIKNGGEWIKLPFPTEDELGGFQTKVRNISSAKCVSGDGKVILGFLGSFSCPIIWTLNDNGEYVFDFFPERFVKVTEEDLEDEDKELYSLSGMYLNLSNNGKYVSMLGLIKDEETGAYLNTPVIYDTETKSIKIYKELQGIDENGVGLYPLAICNDGTFVGTIGQPYFGSYGSFIMKSGQTNAETYNDAFPAYADKLGESDTFGYNMPTGMSADGKYILGYTYYSEDYNAEEGDAYYVTYVISTGAGNAVEGISSESIPSGKEQIYSVDGRKLNRISKGLNIVRDANGNVQKILK